MTYLRSFITDHTHTNLDPAIYLLVLVKNLSFNLQKLTLTNRLISNNFAVSDKTNKTAELLLYFIN